MARSEISRVENELLLSSETGHEREPKIVLHFFRHSEKEKAPGKSDKDIRLSPHGRELAKQKANETNLSQAVAFGSPRERTHETALLAMTGNRDEITGNETLEELRDKIDAELAVGSKLGVDNRLDFTFDESGALFQEALAAVKRNEYLKFIVEQSDQRAKDLNDEIGSTYSRQAAAVSEIILKYIGIVPRWEKILKVDSAKKYSDTLERFFGSHQGVLESFLAKVIELTEGEERRDEFVTVLDNQGFDYVEGFNVEISQNEPMVHLSYFKTKLDGKPFVFNKELTSQQLKDIANLK
ncbi:MAG: histidine phosphatase family protein [Candidatus Uhrbacteria bacterium]